MEGDFLNPVRGIPRSGGDLQFAEDKVSMCHSAGAFLGQSLIQQGIESESVDMGFPGGHHQGQRVGFRGNSGEERRLVFHRAHCGSFFGPGFGEGRGGPYGFFNRELLRQGCGQGIRLRQAGLILCLLGGFRQFHVGFLGVVEEGHQLVVLPMGNGVVLMGMALGAPDGKSQPGGAGGGHAIGHRMEAELERVDAAFFVEHRVPMEPGGDALVGRGVGQQVAGQLFDGEPIEGHVGVEGPDHPIPPRPDAAGAVFFVAVGVGVASQVHPSAAPAFAIAGRCEQLIHPAFITGVAGVFQEGFHLGRRGRETRQIEGNAAGQRVGVGRLGWRKSVLLESLEDELVDRIPRPIRRSGFGRRDGLGSLERPVGNVFGAGGDPGFEGLFLGVGECLTGARRRHDLVGIPGVDTGDQFAGLGLARDQSNRAGLGRVDGGITHIEAQVALA